MRNSLTGSILVVVVAASAGAQTTRVSVTPTSKLWIEGTSNVHAWKCEATKFDATIDIDQSGLTAAPSKLVKKVGIKVPVADLKCGNGKMDSNLRKALNDGANANITYSLTTVEVIPSDIKDAFILRAVGMLTVAGTENRVTSDVNATRLPNGTIKATGSFPVKMTAFAVKPPKAMFGTIKTGDEVTVKFELVVGPKVIAAIIK